MPPKFKRHLSQEDLSHAMNAEKEKLLGGEEDEEEDFFLRGPSSKSRSLGQPADKLNQVKMEIDEVSTVMKNNIEKIIDRGERLEDLEDKSAFLSSQADEFHSTSKKMSNRMWWRNMKIKLLLVFIVLVILLIIILPIVLKNQ